MDRCRASFIYFINLFCWTKPAVRVHPETGQEVEPLENKRHVPFVTRPGQDNALLTIHDCVLKGLPVLVRKSRREGASWINIAYIHWNWLFKNDVNILEVSKSEPLVDKTGDPLALFWKHDYINQYLPDWMLPCERRFLNKGSKYRTHLSFVNPKTGSTITGQATTDHIGRGGGYLIIFYDEFAAFPNGAAAWRSGVDAGICRIANSTPVGPGTEYSRLAQQAEDTGYPVLVEMMYWDNPDRAPDRVPAIDEDGTITKKPGRHYWDCKWLRARIREATETDIGQNVFADDIQAGDNFFDSRAIHRHIKAHTCSPLRCFLNSDGDRFTPSPTRGNWYVWESLDKLHDKRRWTDFVMFADISYGEGASNSVIAVMDRDTNKIVAEYVDPNTPKYALASEIVAAAKGVFKGRRGYAFVGWESSGPGVDWYREVVERLRFRKVYYRRREGSRLKSKTRQYGWLSDRKSKEILMSSLDSALCQDQIIIPSKEGLLEMLEVVWLPDGSIEQGVRRDESSGARVRHGDRIIAYAGCIFMKQEVGKFESVTDPAFPVGTWGEMLGHNRIFGLE